MVWSHSPSLRPSCPPLLRTAPWGAWVLLAPRTARWHSPLLPVSSRIQASLPAQTHTAALRTSATVPAEDVKTDSYSCGENTTTRSSKQPFIDPQAEPREDGGCGTALHCNEGTAAGWGWRNRWHTCDIVRLPPRSLDSRVVMTVKLPSFTSKWTCAPHQAAAATESIPLGGPQGFGLKAFPKGQRNKNV